MVAGQCAKWLAVVVLTAGAALTPQAEKGIRAGDLDGWDIVVAPDAPPAVLYAAEELQRFLAQAGRATLPIVREAARPDRHVFIGPGEALRAGPAAVETEDLGAEAFTTVIREDAAAIAGGSPRGTLYGVYDFLERHLGVRFLTPDHTHVPPLSAETTLPGGTRTYRPPFSYRECFYAANLDDHVFAARMRQNAVCDEARLGGRTPWRRVGHTVHRWVPVSRYGREHPEYFAEIDGRRYSEGTEDNGPDGTQPCMTHPDVRRLVIEGVLEQVRRNPSVANVAVGQNDTVRYCQCETCRVIDRRERSGMGCLLTLVNKASDAVSEEYPEIHVSTLAYFYSRRPPDRIRPRENVDVQVCGAEACLIHAIDDPACPANALFAEDLAGWRKATPNLYVWTYAVNFRDYLLPCPSLRAIGPNLRFFADKGVKGVFVQAAGETPATELADLRNYLACRLLWDPSLDERGLLEEFARLHYGAAAKPILEYVDLIHDSAEASGLHRSCSGPLESYGIGAEVVARGRSLFDRAQALAPDDVVRSRVERASLAVARAEVEPLVSWVRTHPEGGRLPPELKALRLPTLEFLRLCRKHGVSQVSEGVPLDEWEALLRDVVDPY